MSLHAPTTAPGRAALPPGRTGRRRAALGALLLTLTTTPAAVLVVPDATVNVVPAAASALDLGEPGIPGLLRATGLSLPALLTVLPLAAVAARRFSPWPVLAIGLAALLTAVGAVPFVDSVPLAGTVRAVQGAGAGAVLPSCLVLVWERQNRALTATFAGALTAALLLAAPLTLEAVPRGAAPDWHVALAPYQWPAVAAAVATLVHLLLRGRGPWTLPTSRHTERGQLLLPLVPSAGFAFLAVVAAPDWSPGAQLTVAALTLPALLGLALTAAHDRTTGSPAGCAIVMIATGLLIHPIAGPLAATDTPPPLPFAVAAAAAMAGALASLLTTPRRAVPTGYALVVTAIPTALLANPADDPWTLLAPLTLLGTGTGVALAASLRDAAAGAALFGLSLCFPAALAGQLAVLSLQAAQLEERPTTEAQRLDALQHGFHMWLAVAATIAVLLAAVTVRHARKAAVNPQPR